MNNNKKTGVFSHLMKYLGKYRYQVIIAIIFSVIGAIFNLLGPGRLSKITDMITNGLMTAIDIQSITEIVLFLAILYGLGFILNYIQGFIMATVSQKLTQNMRHDISVKINKLPLRYFDNSSTGDILSRVTNDVDTIGQMLNQSLSTLVSSLALLAGSVFLMFSTNWIMALSGIIAAIIGFILMMVVISHSQKYFSQQQFELGNIDGHIEEVYSGHTVVKVYNAEKSVQKEFRSINNKLYKCAWKSQFLSGLMMPLMAFIGNLSYVVVCIVGAILAMNGSITFGTIVAFMLYIRLFTQPLQNLAQAATSLQSMIASSKRIFEFLNETEMTDESSKTQTIDNIQGNINFDHVHFGYSPRKTVINNFSAKVKPGQKIAIVGPTGAGKTTLVNLLMRFYEISGGQITIDGTNIADITRENVHDLFGMVLQDTWVFEGTIRENLIYNKENISDKQLFEICKEAGLDDFIEQLPNGLDTVLDENTSLSAGQKQLITIARAMVENAPLLILDEATSSVDTRTEIKVQSAMDKLTQGRTSFVIAHRLSTIKNSDLILVMNGGDIIESGTHNELISQGGMYCNLYNSQFEEIED